MPEQSLWAGKRLGELGFSHTDGVMVAAIVRGAHRLNVPDAQAMLFPGDRLEVIGDDESLQAFATRLGREQRPLPPLSSGLQLRRLLVRDDLPFVGQTLAQSGMRERWHCMAVGFEDDEGNIEPATASRLIRRSDVMWVVGEEGDVCRLVNRESL